MLRSREREARAAAKRLVGDTSEGARDGAVDLSLDTGVEVLGGVLGRPAELLCADGLGAGVGAEDEEETDRLELGRGELVGLSRLGLAGGVEELGVSLGELEVVVLAGLDDEVAVLGARRRRLVRDGLREEDLVEVRDWKKRRLALLVQNGTT